MGILRTKMEQDLIVRGRPVHTRRAYLRAVSELARYYHRSPDNLSNRKVQQYLCHLIDERRLTPATCRRIVCALHFFYEVTLGRNRNEFPIPLAKEAQKLPSILSQDEVSRLLGATANLKHRLLLMTTYAAGLRVGEVVRLRVTDIDSQRMLIRVEQGKGKKDRYTLLSPRLLEALRHYYRVYQPTEWLFPQRGKDLRMSTVSALRRRWGSVRRRWGSVLEFRVKTEIEEQLMARPLRVEFPGALYHVTARGNERKPIYRDDRDRARFLERVAAVARQHRLVLHAYVLMRNHYHLLVETPEANLARAMGQLGSAYTQDVNRRHRRSGHLFQGRYKALLVDKDSYLLELSRYIHLNPVRVGEVSRACDFPWSSAAAYVGKAAAPGFLRVEEVLGHFGRRLRTARRRYAEFLIEGETKGVAKPWGAVQGQVLLGERRWVERMKRRLAERTLGEEVSRAQELRPRPPLSVVITQVCRAAQVDKQTLLRPRGDRGGWARPIAMALAWKVCGLRQREIGRQFGVSLYAVSKAIAQAPKLAASKGRTGRIIGSLNSNFKG